MNPKTVREVTQGGRRPMRDPYLKPNRYRKNRLGSIG
jgi:hypothetical protein